MLVKIYQWKKEEEGGLLFLPSLMDGENENGKETMWGSNSIQTPQRRKIWNNNSFLFLPDSNTNKNNHSYLALCVLMEKKWFLIN